jgi:tetratricopeptide (TPR) repeat protein
MLCLLVAVILRDVWYLHLVTRPDELLSVPMCDSTVYLQIARELATGGSAAHAPFYWSPLYSLIVALWAGAASAKIVVLQMFAGFLTVGLVFLAGQRLGSRRAGFFGALCLALYSPFLMEQSKLLPVTFAILFALLGIGLAIHITAVRIPQTALRNSQRTARSPNRKILGQPPVSEAETGTVPDFPQSAVRSSQSAVLLWLVSGISLGLSGLLMPQLLLAPVLLCIALLFMRISRKWPAILLVIAGTAIPIVPIAIRNAVAGHDFVPISSSGGFNFYLGWNSGATGLIGRPKEMFEFQLDGRTLTNVKDQQEFQQRYAENQVGHRLRPSQASSFWFRRSLDFIRRRPVSAIKLLVRKLGLSLSSYEFANSYYPELERRLALPLRLAFLPWALLLGLAVAGIVLNWRRDLALLPVLVLPVTVLISLLLFFVNARYRLPAAPSLAIFAGLGIDAAIRNRRRLVFLGITLLVTASSAFLLPATFAEAIRLDEAYGWRNLSINAQHLGRYDLALDLLDRSAAVIQKSPRDSRTSTQYDDLDQAYVVLGNTLLDNRNPTLARRAYDQALKLNPQLGPAYLMRGVLEFGAGELRAALQDAEQTLHFAPEVVNALVLKSRCLLLLRDRPAAESTARQAARLDPQGPLVQQLLKELNITP